MSFQLTDAQLLDMMLTAKRLGMDCPPMWRFLSLADLRAICNGIGPDKFPGLVHEIADNLLDIALIPSGPHDVGYEFALGTREDWHQRNEEFIHNVKRVIDDRYPEILEPRGGFWGWVLHFPSHVSFEARKDKRIALREVAELLFDAVESSEGWDSYMAAYKRGPGIPKPTA